jgi:hypothetical protein
MPDQKATVERKRTYCPICGYVLTKKGICWNCYDRENQEPQEESAEAIESFISYRGGRWLVDNWMEDGISEAEAIAQVQSPSYIRTQLFFGSLSTILADHWATEALRQLLIKRDKLTLEELSRCVDNLLNPQKVTKRGPRAKDGLHREQEVLRLWRAGKKNSEIAELMKTDYNTATAALTNITNKIAKRQLRERSE